jgi:hypothetical protein
VAAGDQEYPDARKPSDSDVSAAKGAFRPVRSRSTGRLRSQSLLGRCLRRDSRRFLNSARAYSSTAIRDGWSRSRPTWHELMPPQRDQIARRIEAGVKIARCCPHGDHAEHGHGTTDWQSSAHDDGHRNSARQDGGREEADPAADRRRCGRRRGASAHPLPERDLRLQRRQDNARGTSGCSMRSKPERLCGEAAEISRHRLHGLAVAARWSRLVLPFEPEGSGARRAEARATDISPAVGPGSPAVTFGDR